MTATIDDSLLISPSTVTLTNDDLKLIRTNILVMRQDELCRRLDVNPSTLSHWENGHRPIPRTVILAIQALVLEKRLARTPLPKGGGNAQATTAVKVTLHQHVFFSALEAYREWWMTNMTPIDLRNDTEIAKSLRVGRDTFRKWRSQEVLPISFGRMLELLCMMIVNAEKWSMQRTDQSVKAAARMEVSLAILEQLNEDGDDMMVEERVEESKKVVDERMEENAKVVPTSDAINLGSEVSNRIKEERVKSFLKNKKLKKEKEKEQEQQQKGPA